MNLHFIALFTLSGWSLILMWLTWLAVGVGLYFLTQKYVRSALIRLIESESEGYEKDEHLDGR